MLHGLPAVHHLRVCFHEMVPRHHFSFRSRVRGKLKGFKVVLLVPGRRIPGFGLQVVGLERGNAVPATRTFGKGAGNYERPNKQINGLAEKFRFGSLAPQATHTDDF